MCGYVPLSSPRRHILWVSTGMWAERSPYPQASTKADYMQTPAITDDYLIKEEGSPSKLVWMSPTEALDLA